MHLLFSALDLGIATCYTRTQEYRWNGSFQPLAAQFIMQVQRGREVKSGDSKSQANPPRTGNWIAPPLAQSNRSCCVAGHKTAKIYNNKISHLSQRAEDKRIETKRPLIIEDLISHTSSLSAFHVTSRCSIGNKPRTKGWEETSMRLLTSNYRYYRGMPHTSSLSIASHHIQKPDTVLHVSVKPSYFSLSRQIASETRIRSRHIIHSIPPPTT